MFISGGMTKKIPANVAMAPAELRRTDLVQRRRVVAVVLAVDGDVAGRRPVELEDQAHRRRLPGPVRPQEAGHDPRLHHEGEIVDGDPVAVVLRQALRFDHEAQSSRAI
jgi:hypothetical protein